MPFFGYGCTSTSKESAVDVDVDSVETISQDTTAFEFNPEDEFLGLGIPEFGDLDSMIARRRIRALVPFTHAFYYIDGKERKGIAYEALNLFEKSLNKELGFHPPRVRIVFIPVNRSQIVPLLRDGYADMAFAGMTITPERQELVDFSIPTISGLREVVVGGPIAPKLSSLRDLSGQQVYVHEGSSYYRALQHLNDSLQRIGAAPVLIEAVDPYLEVEDILEMVNAGAIPFTVLVEPAAQLWSDELKNLTIYADMPVSRNISDGWVFRKGSPKLKQAADAFLKKNGKGTLTGNMLYNKYLRKKTDLHGAHKAETVAQVKGLETMFKKYAAMYHLDWLLLAAQGYQESQLNQSVVSKAGAVGIMQIRPSTAANAPINIPDVRTADNNIHAGAKYMRYLIDHYFADADIDSLNQELLALAAYNAGPTRIARLRKQAAAKRLDPNQWFDHVEIIAAQEIGRETVQYVSNIYKFYASYRALRNYASQRGKLILPE